MIRINFLTSFKEYAVAQGVQGVSYSDEEERKQIIIEVAKRVLIIVIGPLGLYIYETQRIPELREKQTQAEAKLAEIKQFNDSKQGLAQEIKKYEDEQARFNAQMDFINKIQADKVNEYKLFTLLKNSTPPTVWVNELSFMNNSLQIFGQSTSAAAINEFTQVLSNTDFLTPPIPVGQEVVGNYMSSGAETIRFELKMSLNSTTTPTGANATGAAGGTK